MGDGLRNDVHPPSPRVTRPRRSLFCFYPFGDDPPTDSGGSMFFCFYPFDTDPPTRSGVSMFPVLPTIGFEATF